MVWTWAAVGTWWFIFQFLINRNWFVLPDLRFLDYSVVRNNCAAHSISFLHFSLTTCLLGTARLLILLKDSYLHVYLELKIHCFRENFVNFTWYMTTIRPINMSNSLLHTITSIFHLLMAHKCVKSQYFRKFSHLHVY